MGARAGEAGVMADPGHLPHVMLEMSKDKSKATI